MVTSLFASLSQAAPMEIGSPAPQLEVTIQDGSKVDLGKALSEGLSLVYFYPKADTPGCTKQACSLRDGWEALRERGVTVYGVSADKPAAQQAFIDKYKLPFDLIADTDRRVHKAFDTPRFGRRAFLFQDGKLVWLDLKASTAQQADDVLKALDALKPTEAAEAASTD